MSKWRVGRKVGGTIYRQQGAEPSDDDELIGVMDDPRLAATVVDAVNVARRRSLPPHGDRPPDPPPGSTYGKHA